jgi:hypothetical protein
MAKPTNILHYWSPLTVRKIGFDVPLPLEMCVNRLDKYLAVDPKEWHWRPFQKYTIDWSEKSDEKYGFKLAYRIRDRNHHALATCNGTLKKYSASLTSIDTEIKVHWQAIVLTLSLAALGLATLTAYGYGIICIPIPVLCFVWFILSWRASVKARESLVTFIQAEFL